MSTENKQRSLADEPLSPRSMLWFFCFAAIALLQYEGLPWLSEQGYLRGHTLAGLVRGQWTVAPVGGTQLTLEGGLIHAALFYATLYFVHRAIRPREAERAASASASAAAAPGFRPRYALALALVAFAAAFGVWYWYNEELPHLVFQATIVFIGLLIILLIVPPQAERAALERQYPWQPWKWF